MPGTGIPFIFRFFNTEYLACSIPGREKVLYLTFDDGPIPEITPAVLDILRDRDAKATFFCVGDNVRKYPEIFKQIVEEGHGIGNHTFNHMNGWKTPPGEYFENVMRCNEFFTTHLFRPPYGKFTPSQYMMLKKDFRFIMWSVLTLDYHHGTSPEQCLKNSIQHTGSGDIVVFHNNIKAVENLYYALPRFLDHFKEAGYEFRKITG
ncbi:MAG: polysaccharide deacetylase family protein [Bacteroidota bacterium]|nr:polysaccharide deacetylase family protein [Bacteroidota bacterium]